MNKKDIGSLIDYCAKCPEIYNEVSRQIYKDFEIVSAEIVLLVTYYVNEERRRYE